MHQKISYILIRKNQINSEDLKAAFVSPEEQKEGGGK